MTVLIFDTREELEAAGAEFVERTLADCAGPATFGLAGGSTPKATYQLLREADLDWSPITAWLSDERWVPGHHEESNTRMAREALLDHVSCGLVAPDPVGDPHEEAARYEAALAEIWVERDGVVAPDLVLLGIGDDGHTASLFPDTDALHVRDRNYVANRVVSKNTWRLTATMPLLWSARKLAFLVAGEGKAAVLERILEGDAPYPAQQVAAGAADVTWFVDAAAASRLRKTPR